MLNKEELLGTSMKFCVRATTIGNSTKLLADTKNRKDFAVCAEIGSTVTNGTRDVVPTESLISRSGSTKTAVGR